MNKEQRIANPFVVGKYVDDRYFCDREEETAFLLKQLRNGRNVTLISPRRMGKTGLIRHLFASGKFRENYTSIFVDIYATSSLEEFVSELGAAVYNTVVKENKSRFQRFVDIVKSLRPGIKFDAVTGEPTFEIGIASISDADLSLREIFQYLEESDKTCVVAIDEFQQIRSYKSDIVEARLRTEIQQCSKTQFIFAGSEQSVMANIFTSRNKPFYQSTITMGLQQIPFEKYLEFAQKQFYDYGKQIDPQCVKNVYDLFQGTTWFVQMLMNEIFSMTPASSSFDESLFGECIENIVGIQDLNYRNTMSNLSPRQRELLAIIAREGNVDDLMSAEFLGRSGFPSTSAVQSAARRLLDNGILTREANVYRVYDYFFAYWLRHYQA